MGNSETSVRLRTPAVHRYVRDIKEEPSPKTDQLPGKQQHTELQAFHCSWANLPSSETVNLWNVDAQVITPIGGLMVLIVATLPLTSAAQNQHPEQLYWTSTASACTGSQLGWTCLFLAPNTQCFLLSTHWTANTCIYIKTKTNPMIIFPFPPPLTKVGEENFCCVSKGELSKLRETRMRLSWAASPGAACCHSRTTPSLPARFPIRISNYY